MVDELAMILASDTPSFGENSKATGGETADLSGAEVSVNGYVNGEAQTELTLFHGESQANRSMCSSHHFHNL